MDKQQVLRGVIDQFGERAACLRELVQNAIDANTDRIDVRFDEAANEPGLRCVSVEDYGSGMTLKDIDGFLLNVFKSSKEDDLESIGRFGIGFVSVFALQPKYVVVETSRDGQDTRLVIDEDLGIRYLRGEPRLGTRVALYLEMAERPFLALAREGIAFLRKSCRYIEVELIATVGDRELVLNEPLALPLPITAEYREAGTEILVGYGPAPPRYCLMNRRLVLEEGTRALLPGVTVLASSRDLEHNLARNAVIQDAHFQRFMGRLTRLVHDELFPTLLARLTARQGGLDTLLALKAAIETSAEPSETPLDQALLDQALRVPLLDVLEGPKTRRWSLAELRRRADGRVVYASPSADERARLVARRQLVVLSAPPWPVAELLPAVLDEPLEWVDQAFCAVVEADLDTRGHFEALTNGAGMVARRFFGISALARRVTALQGVWPRQQEAPAAGPLVLNVDHPLSRALADLAQSQPERARLILGAALEAIALRPAGDTDRAVDRWLAGSVG